MKLSGPLARLAALTGLLVAMPMLATTPVLAAKADVELLKSYVGSWKGRGTLVGAERESVVCRLTLSEGNNDKVVYQGRCSLAGTALAVNGTLAYIDAKHRYEAAMTSNVTFSGTAIGQKSGNGIVFNLRENDTDEEGNDLTVTASIALAAAKITVDFMVVFNASGDTLQASIPFSK